MMVSKRLLAIVCSLLSLQISAQLSLGLSSGLTRAWEYYGDVILPDNAEVHVNRFYASVSAYLPLNKFMSVGIEPGYVQRGAACVPGWNPIFEGDTRLLLNYIELPLLISVDIPIHDRVLVFGKLGYSAARVVTAFEENIDLETGKVVNRRQLITKSTGGWQTIYTHDQGIRSAAGFSIRVASHKLSLQGRYYHGLVDVDKWNVSKNRSVSVGLGYSRNINFKKKVKSRPPPVLSRRI